MLLLFQTQYHIDRSHQLGTPIDHYPINPNLPYHLLIIIIPPRQQRRLKGDSIENNNGYAIEDNEQ